MPNNATCTCGNTAVCRACVTTITAAVAREARPPAQRTGIGPATSSTTASTRRAA